MLDVWPRDEYGTKVKWGAESELDPFVVSASNGDTGETYEVKSWYSVGQWLSNLPGGLVPERFNDSESNPVGPPWRRVWDIQKYGQPD